MRTRKNRGGDINKTNIFKKILSIGYELETLSLAKLSAIDTSDDGEPILLNSDSLTKDYEIIKRIQNDNYTDEEYEYYANRLEEFVDIDPYTTESINKKKNLIKYHDATFVVSNDLSETSFVRYLKRMCNLNDNTEEEQEDLIDKNDLYTFEAENGDKYKFNFETWQAKHCGMFADVEWIFTYYNPTVSKNIILDTFINVAKNLLLHLSNLEKTKGNLVINFTDDKEIVKNPVNRILYNLPDTNLYYLQTHFINEELDLDDICFVPQMTFSCHILNLVDILKEMTRDNIKIFKNYSRISNERIQFIERIENCINLLFKNYNKSVSNERKIKISKKQHLVKSIKNYIFMILFKLDRYFNNYLQDEKVINKSKTAKYLKDTLFFNSRHINYELYNSLKKTISEYFSGSFSEPEIVLIIQNLIIQQSILEEFLIIDKSYVRKNAFQITNKIDKQNKHYGDPYYSLISYFEFFENPIDDPTRRDVNDEPFRDWLQYNSIDIYSSTTDIKKDIVLVEIRSFSRMLKSYIYSIGNNDLRNSMTHGACNRITKNNDADASGGITINTLKQFVEIYDNIQKPKSRKTLKSILNVKSKKTIKN